MRSRARKVTNCLDFFRVCVCFVWEMQDNKRSRAVVAYVFAFALVCKLTVQNRQTRGRGEHVYRR